MASDHTGVAILPYENFEENGALPLSVVDNSFSPIRLTILLDLAYCNF
jgi:hypothetical protein